MKSKKIPSDIANAIRQSAIDGWDDDADMVAHTMKPKQPPILSLMRWTSGLLPAFVKGSLPLSLRIPTAGTSGCPWH